MGLGIVLWIIPVIISNFLLVGILGTVLWAYVLTTVLFILVLCSSLWYVITNPGIDLGHAFLLGLSWMLISVFCDLVLKIMQGVSLEGYFLVCIPYLSYFAVPLVLAFVKNNFSR